MRNRLCVYLTVVASFLLAISAMAVPPEAKIKPLGVTPGDELGFVTASLRNVAKGTYIFLEGIGTDGDGDSITAYSWTMVSTPSGSGAVLDSVGTPNQSFRTDLTGEYIVSLVVTAGGENSAPYEIIVNASTWCGIGNIGGASPNYPQCGYLCHSEQNATWPATGHATMFQRGIDGIVSSHYSSSCIECHTVGYDTDSLAVNHGFDDVADSLGWVFPDTLIPGNFDSLCANYPELAQLTNIQCENCHGPGQDHGGDTSRIDYTFNEGVCGQCHDAPTHHMFSSQWQESKHSHSADMSFVVSNTSCITCMTTGGFVDSIINGNPPVVAEFPEPINCIACHDPHDATNDHQLRLYGTVDVSGTPVDAGIAAVCMICHNAHDAQVGESVHHSQSEMFEGFGGYEYPGHNYPSAAHKYAIGEKCVHCHMAEPDTALPDSVENLIGLHTWSMVFIDDPDTFYNVYGCTECHGPISDFDVGGTQTYIKTLLNELDYYLALMDTSTIEYKQAKFNYDFVNADGSRGVHNHTYAESLLIITLNELLGVEESHTGVPLIFKLSQSYPNPFRGRTDIKYAVPKRVKVVLKIYDITGRVVRDLVNNEQKPGHYVASWDGRNDRGKNLSDGIYFYRLEAGKFVATKKLILLR